MIVGHFQAKTKNNKKKISSEKKFLYFRKQNFLAPEKYLIERFYTLNKTPLGETGCLSNPFYLMVAQASGFFNLTRFPKPSQLGYLW